METAWIVVVVVAVVAIAVKSKKFDFILKGVNVLGLFRIGEAVLKRDNSEERQAPVDTTLKTPPAAVDAGPTEPPAAVVAAPTNHSATVDAATTETASDPGGISPNAKSVFDILLEIDREFVLVMHRFAGLPSQEIGIMLVRRILGHAQRLFSGVVWPNPDGRIFTSLKMPDTESEGKLRCYFPKDIVNLIREDEGPIPLAGTFAGDVFSTKKHRYVEDAVEACRIEPGRSGDLINRFEIGSLVVWPVTVRSRDDRDEIVACLKVDSSKKSVINETSLSDFALRSIATKFSWVLQLMATESWNPQESPDHGAAPTA